jgi:precorrin-8X/cobalt-precorrin-8 methylmutase
MEQSFAVIDREMSVHGFTSAEYAIARRVIHSTADFEFQQLLRFSPEAIEIAIAALRQQTPIITDVGMVKQGIVSMVAQTFNNPLICAVDYCPVDAAKTLPPGKTRTETGLLHCLEHYPGAIVAIGNAPTALLALCAALKTSPIPPPAMVIGVPVGFISVVESKVALAQTALPHILVEGRKGGSPVAAAIVNALLVLAWEQSL